jgi:hypothetical protein
VAWSCRRGWFGCGTSARRCGRQRQPVRRLVFAVPVRPSASVACGGRPAACSSWYNLHIQTTATPLAQGLCDQLPMRAAKVGTKTGESLFPCFHSFNDIFCQPSAIVGDQTLRYCGRDRPGEIFTRFLLTRCRAISAPRDTSRRKTIMIPNTSPKIIYLSQLAQGLTRPNSPATHRSPWPLSSPLGSRSACGRC